MRRWESEEHDTSLDLHTQVYLDNVCERRASACSAHVVHRRLLPKKDRPTPPNEEWQAASNTVSVGSKELTAGNVRRRKRADCSLHRLVWAYAHAPHASCTAAKASQPGVGLCVTSRRGERLWYGSLQAPICIAHRHLRHPHLHRLLLLGHCFPRTHLLHPAQSVDHLQLQVVERRSLQTHALNLHLQRSRCFLAQGVNRHTGEERRRRCFDTMSRKRWTKRR